MGAALTYARRPKPMARRPRIPERVISDVPFAIGSECYLSKFVAPLGAAEQSSGSAGFRLNGGGEDRFLQVGPQSERPLLVPDVTAPP